MFQHRYVTIAKVNDDKNRIEASILLFGCDLKVIIHPQMNGSRQKARMESAGTLCEGEALMVASSYRLTMWPVWILPKVEEAGISWALSWPGLRHCTSIEVGIVLRLGRSSEATSRLVWRLRPPWRLKGRRYIWILNNADYFCFHWRLPQQTNL